MDGETKVKGKEERSSRERERSRRGDRPSRFSSNTRERSPIRERKKNAGDRRVYVSNVAYESRWQEIKDLFREEVGEVEYVELFVDENEKPRGCGIVEFLTPELAARAVEKMHRYDLKGRKLVVKEDSDVERDKYGRPIPSRNRGGGDRDVSSSDAPRRDEPPRSANSWDGNNQLPPMNSNASAVVAAATSSSGNSNSTKWGNTYGLSVSFLESLWINGPLVSKVFVANLDYKVDEKKLREVFKLAGKVIHAEISVDKEGKSRGFGVVEYEHPVEAVQAISMLHNQILFDRRLTVRMDRVNDKPDGPPKLPEGLKGLGMGLGSNGAVLNDVSRNLHFLNPSPLAGLANNVQQLQAAAAVAQAQLAQGGQLGQPSMNPVNQGPLAAFGGNSSLAPNLTGVNNLLGHSLNVSELANQFGGPMNSTQAHQALGPNLGSGLGPGMGPGMGPGLGPGLTSGLNAGMSSGLGVGGGSAIATNFNAISQCSFLGGNSSTFTNSASALPNTVSAYGQSRDFDAMSAALSNNASNSFNSFDRDNFRGGNNTLAGNFNGSSRSLGNGRGSMGNNLPNTSRRSDTVVVKNLPPNFSWNQLKDKFRDVGEIVFADLSKDSGVIRFSSEWEAERAVQKAKKEFLVGASISCGISAVSLTLQEDYKKLEPQNYIKKERLDD